ncbi:hypothetical protein MASR2M48_05090 [Spirochaetota bacterium]
MGFAYNNLTVSKTAAGNIVNLAALASVGGALTVTQGTLNLAGNLLPPGWSPSTARLRLARIR